MIQETFSGVELLALYGDTDDRIGLDDELLGASRFRRGLRKVGRGIKTAAKLTPHYQAYRAARWGTKKIRRRLRGEDERVGEDVELLGRSFRRGLKKAARFTPHYWAYRGAKAAGKKVRRGFRFRGEDGTDYLMDGDSGEVYTYGQDRELLFLGEVEELGAFLPGLKKGFKKVGGGIKKVGKVTSGFTTGIARAVGVPQSVIDATSKLDPTRKGTTARGAVKAITPQAQPRQIAVVKSKDTKIDAKKIAIIAGAGVAGIVLVKLVAGRRGK